MTTAPCEDPRLARELTESERRLIDQAREKAHILYEGRRVPHRSCGIAIAETFGLATRPYQALRRGGITGCGECGALKAGELVLGEILGDPEPTGRVTENLRLAAAAYRQIWTETVDRGVGGAKGSIVCNDLTAPFPDFLGPQRQAFCTSLAADVAAAVAQVLVRFEALDRIEPIPNFETESTSKADEREATAP